MPSESTVKVLQNVYVYFKHPVLAIEKSQTYSVKNDIMILKVKHFTYFPLRVQTLRPLYKFNNNNHNFGLQNDPLDFFVVDIKCICDS